MNKLGDSLISKKAKIHDSGHEKNSEDGQKKKNKNRKFVEEEQQQQEGRCGGIDQISVKGTKLLDTERFVQELTLQEKKISNKEPTRRKSDGISFTTREYENAEFESKSTLAGENVSQTGTKPLTSQSTAAGENSYKKIQRSLSLQETLEYKPPRRRTPLAKYTKISEKMRAVAPTAMQCSFFCGGKNCKYDNFSSWSSEQVAVKGIFSHWVTEDILAMARPNSDIIIKCDIINQFKSHEIRSIINLQKPGEHASCGPGLEESGFTYNPQTFMDNEIYFYNFGWPDYGTAALQTILDMVKVMTFAASEGKMAVHCHAGLGRTGVIIACFLVFAYRMKATDSIHYVRSKRPNAIQTRAQIRCVQRFEHFISPFRVMFANINPAAYEFTLNQYLSRQRQLLHGFEARQLRHIPKLIFVICERLLDLINEPSSLTASTTNSSLASLSDFHKPGKTFIATDTHETTDGDGDDDEDDAGGDEEEDDDEVDNVANVDVGDEDVENDDDEELELDEFMDTGNFDDEIYQEALATDFHTKPCRELSEQLELLRVNTPFMNSPPVVSSASSNDMGNGFEESMKLKTDSGHHHPSSAVHFTVEQVISALVRDKLEIPNNLAKITDYQILLNSTNVSWEKLQQETDIDVLSQLLWAWIEHLKEPVISQQDFTRLVQYYNHHQRALRRLDKGTKHTIEFLICFLAKLEPVDDAVELRLVCRLVAALRHINVDKLNVTPEQLASTNNAVNQFYRNFYRLSSDKTADGCEIDYRKLLIFFSDWMKLIKQSAN